MMSEQCTLKQVCWHVAWTAQSLMDTKDRRKGDTEQRFEDQVRVVGGCMAHLELTSADGVQFENMPQIVYWQGGSKRRLVSASFPLPCSTNARCLYQHCNNGSKFFAYKFRRTTLKRSYHKRSRSRPRQSSLRIY